MSEATVEAPTKTALLRYEDGGAFGESYDSGESFSKYNPNKYESESVGGKVNITFQLNSKPEAGTLIEREIDPEETHYYQVVKPKSKSYPENDVYIKRILLDEFNELKGKADVVKFDNLDFTEETREELKKYQKSLSNQ